MAVSNEDVAAFIDAVLSSEGSDAEKAEIIAEAAAAAGVSYEQIAEATGYSQAAVEAYLEPVGSADDRQQDAIDAATVQPEASSYEPPVYEPPNDSSGSYVVDSAYTPVTAYDYATASGGIGLEAMNQNIRDFFAGNPTEAETRAAMAEFSVSEADIERATGRSLADYYPTQVASPVSTDTTGTPATSVLPVSTPAGPSPEDIRTAALNAQWEAQQARDTNINTFIQGVLNNPNLDDYQRAQVINQSGIGTREEIASATRYSLADVNKFLDQKPPETPKDVSTTDKQPTPESTGKQIKESDTRPVEQPADYVDPKKLAEWLATPGDKSRYVFDENTGRYTYVVDTAYWDKNSGGLESRINELIQSGKTKDEIKSELFKTTTSDRISDYILSKVVPEVSQNTILTNTKDLITPKTIDGQQFQVLDIPGLVKYAIDNKLLFSDVANALAAKFPDLKASDLQYERDRQQISAVAKDVQDPSDSTKTIKSVSYTDALNTAIKENVSLGNLAQFFGQTPAQFTQTVKDNLGSFAATLRDAKLDPANGLSTLLNISPEDTNKALGVKDSLERDSTGGLTPNEILNAVNISGLSITEFVNKYLNADNKETLITNLQNEANFTPEERQTREVYSTFASGFNKDNPLTLDKLATFITGAGLSGDQANKLLGLNLDAKTEQQLNKELSLTPQEKAARTDFATFASGFSKENPLTIQDLANFVTNKNLSTEQATKIFELSDKDAGSLKTELSFTPQERAWREAYQSTKTPISGEVVTQFQATNKLSDADMQRIFDIEPQKLQDLRITTALQSYSGSDKQLSYAELTQFARDNNMDLSKVVDYVGTKDTKNEILSGLQSYVRAENIQSQIGQYVDPISGKDLSLDAANYVAKQLDKLGISGFDQIEARVIPGTAGRYTYEESGEGGQVAVYDPGTPDRTVYINKATGKEIDPVLFDDKAGTKITMTDQGFQTSFDPAGKLAAQLRPYIDPQSSGGAWTTKSGASSGAGFGTDGMIYALADRILTKTGIDDINKLGVTVIPPSAPGFVDVYDPNTGQTNTEWRESGPSFQYYNKETGEKLENFDGYLGGWGQGPGVTHGYLTTGDDGKIRISTVGEDSSDLKTIMPIIMIGAALVAPYVLPELVGAVVTAVDVGAVAAGTAASTAAVSGTGVTGMMMAAGMSAEIAPYAASILVNGTYNGILADAAGGDFAKGFLSGTAPIFGQLASNAVNLNLADFNLPAGMDKAVGNAVTQLISTGKIDPTQMLVAGATPALSAELQQMTGLTAKQANLVLSTIATQGQTLRALTNPATAINFMMANKDLFDNMGTNIVSTGSAGITRSDPVDLGAFNEGEIKQLTSSTNQTLSTTGLDTTAFLEGNNIYNTGQGQFISVDPGQLRTLQDIYGYDPTAGGQATLGTKTDITPEDSGFAQLQGLRFLTEADRDAEDTGWAKQMLGYRIDPKTTTIQQIVDDSGKKHAIPAGAVLNYTPEGDLMGYRVNNVDYRLDKSGGVFKPYSPDTTVPSWNPENKSMDELYNDFKKAVPGASTQQFQGWLMAAIAGQKSGMYVPMSSFNPTPEQKTTLLQDVSNIAKGVGSGVALGGTDLALATLGWAQAAAKTAGYDVKFTSIDDVIKFQADMDKLGNKDFQNIFRSTISSLPTTAAVLLASSTGVGAVGAGATAFTVAGATTAGREYATAYKDLINKGFTPEDAHSKALNRAALIGGVEGLGESIFPGADIKLVRSAMNLAPGDFLKQYGITLAKELPPEVATNLLQTYIDTLPGIGLMPGKEYSKDELIQILRDTTVTTAGQIAVMGGSARLINQFNSQPVTTSNGQQVLNRQGDPVLMLTTTQKPGFTLSLAGPLTGQTTVLPSETAQSSSSESIFDAVLENESKYGYTLQGVNLNNNTFTVKLDDGQTSVFSAEDLLNKALNLRTMENKNLANDVTNSIDVGDRLAVDLARSIQSLPANQVSGTIVSASSKGAIMETMEGQYIFVPNYDAPTARDGVAAGPIQLGDRVIASQNLVTPVTTVATPDGKTTVTVDTLRIDPAAGLGRIIGLNDTQALVVLPNQQVATVNRSNLAEATNLNLKAGATIAVNPNVLSATNIPVATIQDDFGLTNEDLLRSVLTPSLTASQLPSLVSITTPSGQVETIDTRKPNISSGSVISVDPSTNTALVSSVLGKPQVVNLQGTNLQQGANVFFDPTTGTILGTPVSSQPQPATNVVAGIYTPIGTVTSTVNPITGKIDPNAVIPMNPKLPDYTPVGGIGIDTIPGLGLDKINTVDINAGQTLVPITPTTPVETTTNTTTTGVTKPPVKPRVPFPSLFFPYGEKKVIDTNYDNVVVPPPELPGAYEMPYPNYLRPLEPYLGFGLGTLMGDLNAKEPGNGGDQPLQNAQAQAAPAP